MRLLITTACVARPGSMQDLADGHAVDFLAANGLVRAETICVDGAMVTAGAVLAQMFAGIAIKSAAAGPAASAERFPAFVLLLLPLAVGIFRQSGRGFGHLH